VAFLVPLLAAALAATAGATESGRAFFRTAMEYVGVAVPRDEAPVAARHVGVGAGAVTQAPAPKAKVELSVPIEPVPASAAEVTVATESAVAVARVSSATAPPRGPAEPKSVAARPGAMLAADAPRPVPSAAFDPAHALYLEAHALHFTAQDPARALSAWNVYLAAAPGGRFAVEARYNRALCLVRLGRRDEARAALEPFASGVSGGYRQDEARKLLEALGGATGP